MFSSFLKFFSNRFFYLLTFFSFTFLLFVNPYKARCFFLDLETNFLIVFKPLSQKLSDTFPFLFKDKNCQDLFNLQQENAQLKHANAQLSETKLSYQFLEKLVKMIPDPKKIRLSARMAGVLKKIDSSFMLIKVKGAEIDDIVLSENGLLGRITATGSSSARIMLISNPALKVPVVFLDSKMHAILRGGPDALVSTFLKENSISRVRKGELVFTSGTGGVYPPGCVVGIVSQVSKSGVFVKPLAAPEQAFFITVLKNA